MSLEIKSIQHVSLHLFTRGKENVLLNIIVFFEKNSRKQLNLNKLRQTLRTVRPIYRSGVTLLSRCCILYIYFKQIYVLSILNMLHTLRFSLQNAIYFILLPLLLHALFTFYIQGVLKFKCKI
jgi:hypothetical protein